MIRNKKIFIVCITFVVMISFCFSISMMNATNSIENIEKKLNDQLLEKSNEYYTVASTLESSENLINEFLGSCEITYPLYSSEKAAFKKYEFKRSNGFIVYDYKDHDNSFGKLIDNGYSWVISMFDDQGQINKVCCIMRKGKNINDFLNLPNIKDRHVGKDEIDHIKKFEDKWKLSSIGHKLPIDCIKFMSDTHTAAEFLNNNNIKNPSEIKLVDGSFDGVANILYIREGNIEYGIPFKWENDGPEWLDSGAVYEMSRLMELFEQHRNELQMFNNIGDGTLD